MSDTADIKFALQSLARAADFLSRNFHRVGFPFEPTREDARAYVDDILTLAGNFDRVIQAYGEHLERLDLVTEGDVRRDFTNTAYRALEGNATFDIERGIEKHMEGVHV